VALEPDERCPVHGPGEFPPRCAECGRFLPWSQRYRDRLHDHDGSSTHDYEGLCD
jgi:hypothetical protein